MLSAANKPKISIVMPVYGVERYIDKAIKSVLNQDFQDWELLIVNDGSPDRSREIAASFALTDNRIRILDKANGGLSDARNYGLNEACGEFVHFYDSDDWIESDFYSCLLDNINDYDLLISGYKVDSEKSLVERTGYDGELSEVIGTSLYHFVCTYLNFAWNKLFKRRFLVENSLYYEKGLYRIEDSEFMMRFLSYRPKVKIIKYSGYHYMVRNTITLSTVFDDKIIEHAARSIDIYAQIFSQLSKDDKYIITEIAKMNFSVLKSVFYRISKNLTPYKIIQSKYLIDRIVSDDNICKFIYAYMPLSIFEKMFINAIINRRSWFILFMLIFKSNN